MSDRKKVSICIPAYNNEQSLRRLLYSIEIQDFMDYEVIITDDSDGDEVRKLAEEKEYIAYYKNQERLGATANWNAAIAKSSGEYVKIMHHDDWFTDEHSLQSFVDMLEQHPEADMAFCGSRQVEVNDSLMVDNRAEADNSYERFTSEEDIRLIESDYRNLFLGNTIGAPSAVIVRRSALEGTSEQKADAEAVARAAVNESAAEDILAENKEDNTLLAYDEKLTWLVDMEYYMHLLKNNPCFAYTREPLISIGIGKSQLTEQCRDDGELNVFEYGYIYHKYDLSSNKEYKKKMIKVCTDAGKCSNDAAAYGIGTGEYKWNQGKKLLSKVEWKITHLFNRKRTLALLFVFFIVSLIPILMLSGVNQAAGDDFGYGKLTYQAWTETHSLIEVVKAAGETVQQYYQGWQGTWMSIFLFAFQPEVFSPKAYVIVPILMLCIWLGATGILAHYLIVKRAGYDKTAFGMIYLLAATAGLQFLPSTKSGIFWYNGTAHYVVPYAIALFAIYYFLKFMDRNVTDGQEKSSRGIGAYIGLFISMTLLGGGNYQAALLAPGVIFLTGICYFGNKEKRKRLLLCLIPFFTEAVGLIISMKSPGNRARGGEAFGFSFALGIKTIFACFVRGAVQAWEYVTEHPLLLLIFGVSVIICCKAAADTDKKEKQPEKQRFVYPHPIVFAVLSYCVYCAMFAPELYAGVEVSGGVYNMNYYVFLFMVFGDMIYITGAWVNRRKSAIQEKQTGALPVLVVLGLVWLLLCRTDVKQTTSFQCVEYMRSGQAADFKAQMALQKEVLLDESITDAVLPLINDNQGPLMHMPLTENPEAWTNTVVREFYGKNSVVAVPREEWELLTE